MNRTVRLPVVATLSAVALVACKPRKFNDYANVATTAPRSCTGPNSAMEYLNVCGPGQDGKELCKCISRLVMGTDHIGNFWEQDGFPENNNRTPPERRKEKARQMLDLAIERGFTLFDTSPIYADGIENTLGGWIKDKKQKKPDQQLYTLTKGGFPMDVGPGTYNSRLHGNHRRIVENIAEELRWSYPNLHGQIDFYLMHRDDVTFVNFEDKTFQDERGNPRTQTPARTILEVLSDDKVYNDIPHLSGRSMRDHYTWIGVSNWKTPRVIEALRAAEENPGLLKPMINSPYFSLFEMSPRYTIHSGGAQVTHDEMMDPGFESGILIMPYSPLGGFPILDNGTEARQGEDAWEKAKETAKALDNNRDRYWGNVYEAIFTAENEGRFYRVHKASQELTLHGVKYSIDQWLNAYALAHPRTDLLAVGPLSKQHLERTVKALELAKALRSRPDILDWLYRGRIEEIGKLPPL